MDDAPPLSREPEFDPSIRKNPSANGDDASTHSPPHPANDSDDDDDSDDEAGIHPNAHVEGDFTFGPPKAAPSEIELAALSTSIGGVTRPSMYRYNATLHQLFVRRQFDECQRLCEEMLSEQQGTNEFVHETLGLIARERHQWSDAIRHFERAAELAPRCARHRVQIGRILFLLGEHSRAVTELQHGVQLERESSYSSGCGALYWLARAVYHLPSGEMAVEKARQLLLAAVSRSSAVSAEALAFLAKLHAEQGDYTAAVETYERALSHSSDSDAEGDETRLDWMIEVGILLLRMGNESAGFGWLGRALASQPTNSQALLAVGAVMQRHGDHDVALAKYRVAAHDQDYNGGLWSNIGVALLARGKLVAAQSALRKAAYLCPLEPKISCNLGIVYLQLQQACSAFHHLSAALRLQPQSGVILMGCAIALSSLRDFPNARRAYERAEVAVARQVADGGADLLETAILLPQLLLNRAVFELRSGDRTESARRLAIYDETPKPSSGYPTAISQLATNLREALARSQSDPQAQ